MKYLCITILDAPYDNSNQWHPQIVRDIKTQNWSFSECNNNVCTPLKDLHVQERIFGRDLSDCETSDLSTSLLWSINVTFFSGCFAFWCLPCFTCKTAHKAGECLCLPLLDAFGLIPPMTTALRVSIRQRYGIEVPTLCCPKPLLKRLLSHYWAFLCY